VRKGLYDGNTRKEWLTITEEEQTEFKKKLERAQREAVELPKKLEKALKEFDEIQKVERDLEANHMKGELKVAEIEE